MPEGPLELFMASGLLGQLGVLTGIAALAITISSLCQREMDLRASVRALAYSLLPLVFGTLAMSLGLFESFRTAATDYRTTVLDVYANVSLCMMTLFVGLLFSAPLIFLNLIAIARRLPTCAERKREDA